MGKARRLLKFMSFRSEGKNLPAWRNKKRHLEWIAELLFLHVTTKKRPESFHSPVLHSTLLIERGAPYSFMIASDGQTSIQVGESA